MFAFASALSNHYPKLEKCGSLWQPQPTCKACRYLSPEVRKDKHLRYINSDLVVLSCYMKPFFSLVCMESVHRKINAQECFTVFSKRPFLNGTEICG